MLRKEKYRVPVWILSILLVVAMTPMGSFAAGYPGFPGAAEQFMAEQDADVQAVDEAAPAAEALAAEEDGDIFLQATGEEVTVSAQDDRSKAHGEYMPPLPDSFSAYTGETISLPEYVEVGRVVYERNKTNGSGSVTKFTFAGWRIQYKNRSYEENIFEPGEDYTIPEDADFVKLYAQWDRSTEAVSGYHTITYKGNLAWYASAGNMPPAGYMVDGGTFTVSDTVPTYSRVEFLNWNTAKDGTGTTYVGGDEIENVTEDITLYAQWRDMAHHLDVRLADLDENGDPDESIYGNVQSISAIINGEEHTSYYEKNWDGNDNDGFYPEYRVNDTGYLPLNGTIKFKVTFKDGTVFETAEFGETENVEAYNRCKTDHPSQSVWGMDYAITTHKPEAAHRYFVEYMYQNDDGTYTADEELTDIRYDHGEVSVLDSDKVPKSDDYVLNTTKTNEWTATLTSENDGQVTLRVYFDKKRAYGSYKVEYYLQDATGDGYTKDATDLEVSEVMEGTPVSTETAGVMKSFTNFTFNGDADGSVLSGTVSATEVLTLKLFFDRDTYKVSYAYDSTAPEGATDLTVSPYAETTYRVGATVPVQNDAEAAGYDFSGWSTDAATISNKQFTMPAGDVVLTGGFSLTDYTVSYSFTGTLIPEGATAPGSQTKHMGDTVSVEEYTAPLGYVFSGWETADVTVDEGQFTMPAGNVAFTGSFTRQTASYKVEYYLQNADGSYPETASSSQTSGGVNVGEAISTETEGVMKSFANYTFNQQAEGSVLSGTVFTPTEEQPEGLVLRLFFDRDTFKVTYGYTGTIPANATQLDQHEIYDEADYRFGETVEVARDASAAGFDFSGWRCDGVQIENGEFTMPAADVALKGEFTRQTASYTVEYYLENLDNDEFTLAAGETLTVENVDVTTVIDTDTQGVMKTFQHFTFDPEVEGSVLSGEVVKPAQGQEGLVLKLYFMRDRHDVTYIYTGTPPADATPLPEPVSVKVGRIVTVEPDATAEGHKFSGWTVEAAEQADQPQEIEYIYAKQVIEYGEDRKFEMPDAEVTISGGFSILQFTVKYVDGVEGAAFAEQSTTVDYGTATPGFDGTPARNGFNFTGWTPEVADTVKADATYTATWAAVPPSGGGGGGPSGGGGGPSGGSGTTIVEPEVPLAEMPELNTQDHVAYVIGYEDGTVKPENKITRAEVATIFFRLLTDDSRMSIWSSSNSYSDTSATAWYNNAVSTLSNGRVLTGYTDGTFQPGGNITRAEFATIAARFDESAVDTSSVSFTDISGHWAENNIKRAAALGYITGYQDGSFRPNEAITRAEAMTLLNRVLGRDKITAEGLLPDMVTFSDNPAWAWYYVAVQEATNSHDYLIEEGVETWTGILANRDWAALEKEWATGAERGAQVIEVTEPEAAVEPAVEEGEAEAEATAEATPTDEQSAGETAGETPASEADESTDQQAG